MNKLPASFVIALLIALSACQTSRPGTTATMPAPGHTFVDLLAAQMAAIHYRSVVTRKGDTLTARIGAAPAPKVRRATSRPFGWPGDNRKCTL
jgi:hypothetical protein